MPDRAVCWFGASWCGLVVKHLMDGNRRVLMATAASVDFESPGVPRAARSSPVTRSATEMRVHPHPIAARAMGPAGLAALQRGAGNLAVSRLLADGSHR